MKFFEFSQNNSGGSFHVDEHVTHRVLIEADTEEEAIRKGEELGMYWDGCENGIDCPCCGDRWSTPWGEKIFPFTYGTFSKQEAEEVAEKYKFEISKSDKRYGKDRYDVIISTPEGYAQLLADKYGWTEPDCYIYYKSGQKVSITGRVFK